MTKTPDTTPQPNYPDQIIGDKPQPGAQPSRECLQQSAEPAPATYMTEDAACNWAWEQVRQDVGTKGWAAGDYGNFHGFFLWGWNYRGQYEAQRTAAQPSRECLQQSEAEEADLQPEDVGTLDLTQERLKAYLNYDPDTGIFTSRATGKQIGWKGWKGYVGLSVYDVTYRAHRLAWLYMTGEWPADLLDHRDGDRSNNRFSNLRESTMSQNAANGRSKRSVAGLPRGVRKSTNSKSFKAEITVHNRRIHLGNFTTAEEASEVYSLASELIHGDYAYHLSRNKASAAQGVNHAQ